MAVRDKLIQKAKELGLPAKSEDLIRSADKAIGGAVKKAATYAEDNRDKLDGYIDKAGRAVDEKTQGKYSDKVTKAKAAAAKGVDKLAEQRAAGDDTGLTGQGDTPRHDGTAAVPPPAPGQSTTPGQTTNHGQTSTPGQTPAPGQTPPPPANPLG